MIKENIETEYGRVSALKITRFKNHTKEEETVYLPQFEIIEYKASTGKEVKRIFVTIEETNSPSSSVECKSELEALEYAINFRDKL